ncbi:MAG: hypothetical protein KKC68_04145 [Candidatus Thermoplasmatota archaeon]|nr:hypothetical protein [Candidatus Thermoplasmatota archaeon]MBU1940942.1 hypothetical protein [Candidatus Thermoplasmatota archaeon]
MYLITKWFGTFLFSKKGLQNHILFPNTPEELQNKITTIATGQILLEERNLAKNHPHPIVNEKRLIPIGTYNPNDLFFTTTIIASEHYGYSPDLLHTIMQTITQSEVVTILKAPDLQIIQMVNTLDELIQTANLLQERHTRWTILPTPEENLVPLTTTIKTIQTEIIALQNQIETHIQSQAPNTTYLIGPLITARLLAHAGSLQKLAMLPASTIQLLGAEKALFRYKKEGGNPPKHGVIFQHHSINTASRKDRGRIARHLANKITIAIKADVFTKRDIRESLTLLQKKQKKQQS